MEEATLVEQLVAFGLGRQEAVIYLCLMKNGEMTGYEVAKYTGISRSNVYNGLAALVEHGAAHSMEGASTKYIAIAVEQFCDNHIRYLNGVREELSRNCPKPMTNAQRYITIEGRRHILDKMKNLLANVEERAYISCTRNYLLLFVEELEKLDAENKKLVIVTDHSVKFGNAKVYVGEPKNTQVGLITDSKYALTGEYGEGSINTCLYSGQKNFVELYKRALSNEIKLLAM